VRRWLLPLLVLANLALAAWVGWMWFTPAGQIKGVQWQRPAPLAPSLDADGSLPETGVDASRYVATLERPLFSPSRRMPAPPPPPSAAPVVDAPPDIRVKLGEAVGRWTLKALRPGEAVLAAGESEQVYPLLRAASGEPPPSPIADNAGAAGGSSAPRAPAADAMRQRQIEEARANVRRVNALRARMGLPPVPEP
jgi:hypothetical protein